MTAGTIGKTGAGLYLWPVALPLTREVLDAEFSPGRRVPMAPESRLLPVAYHVEVPGARPRARFSPSSIARTPPPWN